MSISSRIAVAAALSVLVAATPAAAQNQQSAWEFRVSSGALVPTGTQRNSLKDAEVTAAQLSWLVRPSLAITGTLGWARSKDLTVSDTPKLDVFNSDLGIELRADRSMLFSPFVGIGAGMRSYNYRSLNVDASNNVAGYVAAGGETGVGRVGLRLEARDYATGFKPLIGSGASNVRNDVVIMAAVRFNRASQD